MSFEAIAVDHIDWTLEQAGDILLEACVFELGRMRRRIDLDHDVEIALRSAVAARHRAEHGRLAARAEVRFGSQKGLQGLRCGSCGITYHRSGSLAQAVTVKMYW